LSTMLSRSLACCTFNVLAPCYRRTGHRGSTEDEDPKAWRTRNDSIFQLLLALKCDVLCLQEVWFNDDFLRELRQAVEPQYCIHLMQRPGKEDGLAILVKTSEFELLSIHPRDFKCVGQRIGLAVRIRRHATKEEFLVGNTHLTFPHHSFDYKLRADQIRNFTTFLYGVHAKIAPEAHLILCGDFNLCTRPEMDNVYRHLSGLGLRSAYCEAVGREPGVTHLTHADESHCVDFVFFGKGMVVKKSYLHPSQLSDEKWSPEFTLSDHRPVVAEFVMETPTVPVHVASNAPELCVLGEKAVAQI